MRPSTSLRARPAVLITGAAGFVGSHLIDLLEQDDVNIAAWQRPGTEPLSPGTRVRWQLVEMNDLEEVTGALGAARPDQVYHLACSPHVGDSWKYVYDTFSGNVLTTQKLFDGLRALRLKPRVLVTCSAMIYKPIDRPLTEDDQLAATSPYATSKLAQEMLAERAWRDDGIPVVIARSFNHVGPRQSPMFVAPTIAKQIAAIEAGKMAPVLSLGNLTPSREITDVRDIVRAYRAMMQSAKPGTPYNVCSGQAVSIQHLVDVFRGRAQVKIEIEQDPAKFRPNDIPLLAGDAAKLRRDTGWAPKIQLEQTVDDLLAYWREHGDG